MEPKSLTITDQLRHLLLVQVSVVRILRYMGCLFQAETG